MHRPTRRILAVLAVGPLASLSIAVAALGISRPPHHRVALEVAPPIPSLSALAAAPATDADLLVWHAPAIPTRHRSARIIRIIRVVRVVRVIRVVPVGREAGADSTRSTWHHHRRRGGGR